MKEEQYSNALYKEAAYKENTEKWKLVGAIRMMSEKKEEFHLLERSSHRWKLNGNSLSHAYPGCSLDEVCKDNDLWVWEEIRDGMALVQKKVEE